MPGVLEPPFVARAGLAILIIGVDYPACSGIVAIRAVDDRSARIVLQEAGVVDADAGSVVAHQRIINAGSRTMGMPRQNRTRSVELRHQRIAIMQEHPRALAYPVHIVRNLIQPAHGIIAQLGLDLPGVRQRGTNRVGLRAASGSRAK